MRKQHLFFFLSIVCLILLYWIPTWEYELGLAGDSQTPMQIELTATALTTVSMGSTPMAIPDIKPSYWYLNTVGIALNIIILLIAFIHFGDLKVQKRWGFLSLVATLTGLIFSFFQVNIIFSQYHTALQADLGLIGSTTVGEYIFKSNPGQNGLILIGISILFVLLAIWSINKDIKLIASMNRLR